MSDNNELESLRTAILSLQSGLLAVLESLEILSRKSDKSAEFSQQIQTIKQAIDQLPSVTALRETASEETDTDEEREESRDNPTGDNSTD